MENLYVSLGQVSIGLPAEPSVFTFVPVVKSIINAEQRSGAQTGKQKKETMTDGEMFTAETVFLKDSVEGRTGNIIHPETKFTWKPSLYHVSLSQSTASPSLSSQSENTPDHVATLTGSMETAVDKHRGTSQQQRHDTFGHAGVSSGCFANRASVSEDRTSPTLCSDLFPTPASSRESILSEGSDKETSWPAVQLSSVTSPASFSRTVSPCSSVLSGIFSPAVVQIKKHFLAPGCSLVNIPQTCFSSCESLSSSVSLGCPRPRHRPPLTRLSLLTAILRKGRLPVLSSVLQRPYTPCWPVNPVTLSFCNACSAASGVASIPMEFSSLSSIDIQSHVQREPNRCVTAPPPLQSNELSRTCPQTQVKRCSKEICSSTVPRWAVISPPPAKSNSPPRGPLPLPHPNFECVPLPRHKNISTCASSTTLPNTHVSTFKSPELKSCNSKGHSDDNLKKPLTPSPKTINKQETFAPQQLSRPPSSSLSRLRLLSQQLRSPPVCSPQPQSSKSRSPGFPVFSSHSASPLPPSQNTTGRCESERRCPDAKSVTPSHGFHRAYCLPPSRYTPIVFSGWPSPASSPTPTPSPAPPVRDLTPSPSLSMRTTPSPRPGSGISDCSDREGKKRKTHRIKLSYKSLAAIPTNTLLLDQQAIDEQVEREDSPCDTLDRGVTLDTHAEMCSPAQLRQQSEELYAAIDAVLANSAPPQPLKSPTGLQKNSTLSKSLGRETKYASVCSLHLSAHVERNKDSNMTKPGIVRPMTAIPRLRVEDKKEFHTNLRPSVIKKTLNGNSKVENKSSEDAQREFYLGLNGQTLRKERNLEKTIPFSVCDLQITEPEDHISQLVKDTSTSSNPFEDWMETHI
ncbi:muscular LMNA-interacting protein isoform X2 [Channa argus]|uniref:muscular LMNA-interacting protein isoform X2 n=1 Tax=Channa argus TaxID=215402 RepID=UPI0035223D27